MSLKKECSKRQETAIASALGWSTVSGSGARHLHPGDVVSSEWLGECKTHTSPGHKITFNADTWSKICKESNSRYKYPVLFVDDGSQKLDNTWVLMSDSSPIPADSIMSKYPYNIRRNIVFSGDELSRRLVNNSGDGRIIVYYLEDWGSEPVLICKFSEFYRAFGEL